MSNLKIKTIKLNNFSSYSSVELQLDKSVTYLIGKNGAGKSTLGITAIWFILEGIAERSKTALIGEKWRFIGPKGKNATGELVLFDEDRKAEIIIRRKITQTTNTLDFEAPEGYPISQEWISNLLNVFLISPKRFVSLSSKEQAVALGIDTALIDARIKDERSAIHFCRTQINRLEEKVNELESEFDGKEEVKVDALSEKIKQLINQKNEFRTEVEEVQRNEQAIQNIDSDIRTYQMQEEEINKRLLEIKDRMFKLREQKANIETELNAKKEALEAKKPEIENIDAQIQDTQLTIQNSTQTNVGIQSLKIVREDLEKTIKELEQRKENEKKLLAERIELVKSKKLPFENLSISDEGELLLNEKPIKEPYFSTGELIKIVPLLFANENTGDEMKYVFIQDFNLLDEEKQVEVEKYLVSKGLQCVIELVGSQKIEGKNCVLLKDSKIVENYNESTEKLSI